MFFRAIYLEFKKIILSRTTLLLLTLSIFITLLMTVVNISGYHSVRTDDQGNIVKLTGLVAIKDNQSKYSKISGSVDAELIKKSVSSYQTLVTKYGNPEKIPTDTYIKEINSYFPINNLVLDTIKLGDTGEDLMNINLLNLSDFYKFRDKKLEDNAILNFQKDNKKKEKFTNMNNDVKKPFKYKYGLGTDDLYFRYLSLLIWILILLLSVIIVPIFSGEIENDSFYIIKSTKMGGARLALTKIISSLGLITFFYLVFVGFYLLISNSIFNFHGVNSSFQMAFGYSKSLFTGSVLQAQFFIFLSGLITMWAVASFVLLISSISRNTVVPMVFLIIMLFLPTFLSIIHNGSEWLDRIIFSLPSSGVGLKNGIDMTLGRFDFLSLNGIFLWAPYYVIINSAFLTFLQLVFIPYIYKKKE